MIKQQQMKSRYVPFKHVKAFAGLFLVAAAAGSAVVRNPMHVTDIDPMAVSSIVRVKNGTLLEASPRLMAFCAAGRRISCVVDGDTFWLDATKYRIANIDTPELSGKCVAERETAQRARSRLAEAISGKALRLSVSGTDRYGRTLATVSVPSGDVGDRLVSEGLAEVWGGSKINWCGA